MENEWLIAGVSLAIVAGCLMLLIMSVWVGDKLDKPPTPKAEKTSLPACEFCGTEYRAKRARYCQDCGKARPMNAPTFPILPPLTYPLSPAVPKGGIIVGPSQMGGYEYVPPRQPPFWLTQSPSSLDGTRPVTQLDMQRHEEMWRERTGHPRNAALGLAMVSGTSGEV